MQVATVIAIQPAEKRMPAPRKHAASCSNCNLRELCLPGALDAEDLARIDNLVYARRRVKRGESLYQSGAEFNAIYAIRSGSFKASLFDGEGREQVSGFFMTTRSAPVSAARDRICEPMSSPGALWRAAVALTPWRAR